MSVSFPKPLTEEEERYYIDIYENGDDDAKEEAKKLPWKERKAARAKAGRRARANNGYGGA